MERTDNDNALFVHYYTRYGKPVRGFIQKYVSCPMTAEDLTQDTFLKVYEKSITIPETGKGTPSYILTTAKNVTLDYIKNRKREKKHIEEAHLQEITLNSSFYESLEDAFIYEEDMEEIENFLESMPDASRRIFMKRIIRGTSYKNLAVTEKVSRYRIKQVEQYAREELSRRLSFRSRRVKDK
jgi:RNA polymerase sigma-70 factor, ECF subfamily